MGDDQDKKQQAKQIEQELNRGLSRRAFLDRLKALGVGFGAAFVFGVNRSDAGVAADTLVSLKSTNPVLNDIIEGSQQDQALESGNPDTLDEESRTQLAQAGRVPYTRIPFTRIPFQRIPFQRVPYVRIPYRRVPFARIPHLPYRRIIYRRYS